MTTPANSNTLLLDLDGTLTDPADGIGRCIVHALDALQLPAPGIGRLRRWIGPPLRSSFAAWFEELDVDADPDTAVALYRERFASKGLFENTLYPGILPALEALRAGGARLLLATSKPVVFARRIVVHFGLDSCLAEVYGSELSGTRGDKAELLAHIIERESLDAKECIMLGDREHDMLAARYHGLWAVGVLWGYGSRRELLDSGAQWLLHEPKQLAAILNICKNDKPKS